MAAEGATDLGHVVALLGAAVVAVPLFKRLGLGSVLGYLAAGILIGPSGIGLFQNPVAILHVAELGVVMLLFIIGLELRPSRLWGLRRDIFGLGLVQVSTCGLLVAGTAYGFGLGPAAAFVAGMGFVMTSTAVVLQLLQERGELNAQHGQMIVAILLFEDLAIVPLLMTVTLLAPASGAESPSGFFQAVIAIAALAGLFAAGRWLLNPMFRLLAEARAREVMTAAALLVVLGAAYAMELGGLSMAMGAFLAGVLLSESSFRHQLEADIEPFRGLLLGLFFLSVGMVLDLAVVAADWLGILALVGAFMAVKAAGIYTIARLFGARHRDAVHRTFLMAQGGEFAFVLYAAAGAAGLIDTPTLARLTAAIILSMALTPLLVLALRWVLPEERESMDGVEEADGLTGSVLVIGFGRFGQVASQVLLARGVDVSIIDNSAARIREAARFGFRIYYGDGTRLDVLRASGAATARIILVCVDSRAAANRIVELARPEFPLAELHVRSYDRGHTLELISAGVDAEVRETFDAALTLGAGALEALGHDPDTAAETVTEVRRLDRERLELQQTGGLLAGRGLAPGAGPTPEPLTPPRRAARTGDEATAELAECRLQKEKNEKEEKTAEAPPA